MTRVLAALLVLAVPAAARAEDPRVRIDTDAGAITARIAHGRAPVSACNFLRYVAAGDYDRGVFFRTVRSDHIVGNPVPIDVIQVRARLGEEQDRFGPIALERTSVTGLRHVAGALSMARNGPDTATSSFSIVVKESPSMDFGGRRNRDGQGFAVFGKVISGMRVVRAIQSAAANGERLVAPVAIHRVALVGARGAAAWLKANCPPV